jgi:hypothetical protein
MSRINKSEREELYKLFSMAEADPEGGIVFTTLSVPPSFKIRKRLKKSYIEFATTIDCPACGDKLYIYDYRKKPEAPVKESEAKCDVKHSESDYLTWAKELESHAKTLRQYAKQEAMKRRKRTK